MEKITSNPSDLLMQPGVNWKHAILKEGTKFCTCDNPTHDGCSNVISFTKTLCEWCTAGCANRKSKLDQVEKYV